MPMMEIKRLTQSHFVTQSKTCEFSMKHLVEHDGFHEIIFNSSQQWDNLWLHSSLTIEYRLYAKVPHLKWRQNGKN